MPPMILVGAAVQLLILTGVAQGPDQITPLLVGRVVEYDSLSRDADDLERQEWFADGTTGLSNMGFLANGTREWRVISHLYCSKLRESEGEDCYHVVTWDDGRRIRFRPVARDWGDYVFDLRRTYIGTFTD